jgi:hypothetical protein
MKYSAGKHSSATSPSRMLRIRSRMPVPISVSIAVMSPSKPVSSNSLIASTSDVWREITRPEVYESWNRGDSFRKWA